MMSIRKQFEHLRIQLEAIISTTNNFAEDKCIGKGGFGKVYKGELVHSKGHATVALKRLDRAFGQGDPEFWKEIIMLSLYTHENIVSLLGFCDESGEKILVYEYASNRSLDLHLNSNDLTWVRRLNICIGVARGLAYLHDPAGSQQRVLHRDIKSFNILLDDNWNAKISDLGLSKFGPANQHYTFMVSRAVGTFGYCDPLYVETGLLTKESDVYSFGVVMFEVLCGRLCIDNKGMHQPFTELVRKCYKKNNLSGIIFGNVKDEINPCSLKAFATIAYRCLKRNREKRPLTNEVVRILETALKYQVPPPPPPPLPPARSKNYNVSLPPPPPDNSSVPLPPPHSGVSSSASINQRPLNPLQLMKTNAKEGSLWNVSQKHGNQSRAPEIDITELESLFSTASMSTGAHKNLGQPSSEKLKPENICLIKPLRASAWEIILGKINLPLHDIIKAILSLDSFAMNVHQVYNLIEFCPTKEEMEIVKSYTGYKKMLGQCEQFFLECAKIPRIKPKLRVFAFTITFSSQVNNLSENLSTIKDATKEFRSTGGFRLDNFRDLGYTYATDKKITLLHYLCKVVAEQTPELLDFDKDLIHLQSASMIQIKSLHEDKYAIINGFEKAQNEFDASDNDGDVSAQFREALKSFLDSADDQLPPLTSSFNEVAQYADSLAVYFGEDPSHVPWEQVITSLVRFIVKFKKAHNENIQWEDSEKKKLEKVVKEEGSSS
ncbi:hypothetical protein Lser_V15G22603 [Lactuca serriola]